MKRLFPISLACLVFTAPAWPQTPEAQAKANANAALFVKRLQTPEGGFANEQPPLTSSRSPVASLRATSSAIRALKYLGSELPNADKCKRFVADCFDKTTGGFADTPGGKADVATTAIGLMAAVELGFPAEPYHAACVKFLSDNAKTFDEIRIAVAGLEAIKVEAPQKNKWLVEVANYPLPSRGEENDNGRSRVQASKLVTLMRLGSPADKVASKPAIADLRSDQRHSGGYGKDDSAKADLESTYRVMRCLMMLGEKPGSVEKMRSFIDKCRNEDGGYGVTPAANSTISGVYYAAIIGHWLDGKK